MLLGPIGALIVHFLGIFTQSTALQYWTPPQSTRVIALEDSRFCRHLAPEDRELVRTTVAPKHYPSGACIFEEGDEGDGLYIVLGGQVEITAKSTPDRRHVLSVMEQGDYFGEMSVFDGGTRSAGAYTRVPSDLSFLPAATVLELLRRSPILALALVKDASLRMRDFNRRFLRESLRAERLALMERVARTIVHDFRNPLNVIGIAAEMGTDTRSAPATRNAANGRIRHQIEVLNGMLQELMDFTKTSSQDVILPRLSYSQFLESIMVEVRAEADRRGIDVKMMTPVPDVPVRLNPARFVRVLNNLTQNAFDAMSGKPGAQLGLAFQTTDTHVVTRVIDNGPGIAAEHVTHLFEPFFTFGKSHGTGLGLAICERIISEHGGKISVETTPGGGATFRFELPIAKAGDTDRFVKTAG